MGNSSSTPKISAQDRAILDMKNQRDRLHQYQKRIIVITTHETNIARDCVARGDKSKALLALRRKKFQESLLAKTDAQLETLEQLTSNVEFALVQKDVVFGLQQGTSVLKQIHREMGGLEHVEKMVGENEEARAYQKEIEDMLRGQMSNQDEDDVEDELEAMEEELGSKEAEEQSVDHDTDGVAMPSAPKTEPVFASDIRTVGEQKARARARAAERKSQQAAEPMLA